MINIDTIVHYTENKYNVTLHKFVSKKIFYVNNNFCLLSPYSKYYENVNAYWVDITKEQANILNSYDFSVIIFRLNNKICEIEWSYLKNYLTDSALFFNKKEQFHWKLYIYKEYLLVRNTNAKASCILTEFNE